MAEFLLYVALCLVGFALVERRLSTTAITGPIVFVLLGLLAGPDVLGLVGSGDVRVTTVIDLVFQVTLVLVLFTDAAALHVSSWRRDAKLPGRMLGIGLPLTVALGAIVAAVLFTDLGFWEAAIIGAIIAPTDAALGQAVISNPRVPERIRQALDVESGLNDGVSLPFVLVFIGLAEEAQGARVLATFLVAIGVAVVVGVAVGLASGRLAVRAARSGFMDPSWSGVLVLAVAVISFLAADALGGSGFIAAFVAGVAYGAVARSRVAGDQALAGPLGGALVQVSFLLFGALVLQPALGALTWQVVVMAVLGLTVVRMGPVALSLTGLGLGRPTVLYLAWFGPRGLATIVFAALVVKESDLPGVETITMVAVVIVGLSVLAHGVTAYRGSERYGAWASTGGDSAALVKSGDGHGHRVRPRLQRPGLTEPSSR